jgi:hypothetical protein
MVYPMTKMQFQAATARAAAEVAAEEGEEVEEKILEFALAGQDFRLKMPTATQIVLLATSSDTGTMRGMIGATMDFLEGLMLDDGYRRLRKLMAQGVVSHELLLGGDQDNEQGIIDWIIEQVSDGTPPERSSGSSASPKPGGPRSTGRAPGKGSIRSGSPSAAS